MLLKTEDPMEKEVVSPLVGEFKLEHDLPELSSIYYHLEAKRVREKGHLNQDIVRAFCFLIVLVAKLWDCECLYERNSFLFDM